MGRAPLVGEKKTNLKLPKPRHRCMSFLKTKTRSPTWASHQGPRLASEGSLLSLRVSPSRFVRLNPFQGHLESLHAPVCENVGLDGNPCRRRNEVPNSGACNPRRVLERRAAAWRTMRQLHGAGAAVHGRVRLLGRRLCGRARVCQKQSALPRLSRVLYSRLCIGQNDRESVERTDCRTDGCSEARCL